MRSLNKLLHARLLCESDLSAVKQCFGILCKDWSLTEDIIHLKVSLGVFDKDKLVSVLICFPYQYVEKYMPALFERVFQDKALARLGIHHKLHMANNEVMFIQFVGVLPEWRGRGLVAVMLDQMLTRFPDRHFALVTRDDLAPLFQHCGFCAERVSDDKQFLMRRWDKAMLFSQRKYVFDILYPDLGQLDRWDIGYQVIKPEFGISGYCVKPVHGVLIPVFSGESISFLPALRMDVLNYYRFGRKLSFLKPYKCYIEGYELFFV